MDDSDTRTKTVRSDSGRLKRRREDSNDITNPKEETRIDVMKWVRDYHERRIQDADSMSLKDLLAYRENLRGQDEGRKRGRPKAPTFPLWKNHGIFRGAVVSMPIVQHACDPNAQEDRRRYITHAGFVDASFRLVVIHGVFDTHIVTSVITTRGGRGS